MTARIRLANGVAPESPPPVGTYYLFVDAGGTLSTMDSAGTVTAAGGGDITSDENEVLKGDGDGNAVGAGLIATDTTYLFGEPMTRLATASGVHLKLEAVDAELVAGGDVVLLRGGTGVGFAAPYSTVHLQADGDTAVTASGTAALVGVTEVAVVSEGPASVVGAELTLSATGDVDITAGDDVTLTAGANVVLDIAGVLEGSADSVDLAFPGGVSCNVADDRFTFAVADTGNVTVNATGVGNTVTFTVAHPILNVAGVLDGTIAGVDLSFGVSDGVSLALPAGSCSLDGVEGWQASTTLPVTATLAGGFDITANANCTLTVSADDPADIIVDTLGSPAQVGLHLYVYSLELIVATSITAEADSLYFAVGGGCTVMSVEVSVHATDFMELSSETYLFLGGGIVYNVAGWVDAGVATPGGTRTIPRSSGIYTINRAGTFQFPEGMVGETRRALIVKGLADAAVTFLPPSGQNFYVGISAPTSDPLSVSDTANSAAFLEFTLLKYFNGTTDEDCWYVLRRDMTGV